MNNASEVRLDGDELALGGIRASFQRTLRIPERRSHGREQLRGRAPHGRGGSHARP